MKAQIYRKYGMPDVMQLEEVEKPVPKADEVLIKVKASSVNPMDWHMIRGIFPVRIAGGLFKPKNKILGADVAGIIESVGKEIKTFQPGDEVFGDIFKGAFAEYVCVKQDRICHKPKNISYQEAAAVPLAGITALQSIRYKWEIKPDWKVLINGASGGVGTFAVQIAALSGAEITGVCSTSNIELVKSLGANEVIDYTNTNLVELEKKYDLVIDNVGNLSLGDIKKLLKPEGIGAVVGFTSMKRIIQISMGGSWKRKKNKPVIGVISAKMNHSDLQYLAQLLDEEKVKPVIDTEYSFEEIPEALWYIGKKKAKGKVVISY